VDEAWRFVAIMEQSGSGKPALLTMLADVESADAGEIDIGSVRLDWTVRQQRI
jgi:putative ABC transport system ATP-binding protein